jgi:tetratricopeptide (TPR) repeat protein
MLVGNPGHFMATAFVISAKHRLLATNAHVADEFYERGTMVACGNGTTTTYTVDRVWYHPGVVRQHDPSLAMRCQDPSHGKVLPGCSDVAVLHLAEGPELPAELSFATPEELNDLFAQSVAMLGFPGCDQQNWPAAGEKPQASFRDGAVNRLGPLKESGNRDSRELQAVQYSIAAWFGASGAPVFLPNGHVVAINAWGRETHYGPHTTDLVFGIRVDCLWELLAYHNLTDQVPIPASEANVNLARFREVDPYEASCHAAMALVGQCDRMMLRGDFQLACENCNQALLLAPGYATARRVRGNVLREFVGAQGGSLPPDRKLELLSKALQDIQQYLKAVPDDPWGAIDAGWTMIWIECVRTGNSSNPQILAMLTKLLDSGVHDSQQRACALFVRAAAANYDVNYQADLDEAVRLAPCGFTGAAAFNTRGTFRQRHGRPTEASADFRRASELLEAERLAAKAQEILERTQASEDDLKRASDSLAQAGKLTSFGRWQHAYLMAFLQHRLGDDASATAWAAKALSLAPDSRKARIRVELAAYNDAVGRVVRTECYGPLPSYPVERTFQPDSMAGSAAGFPNPRPSPIRTLLNFAD